MIISVFAVLFLCIIAIPRIKTRDAKEEYLSQDDTLSLKGLSCVAILFHHFSGWIKDITPVIYVMSHWGSFVVAIFFFISAYGITKSSYKNKNISGAFLIKRLTKILIPYWICDIICICIYLSTDISGITEISAKNIILSVFTLGDVIPFSWYVSAILFLYFVFYICAKILPKWDLSLKVAVICAAVSPFVPDLWAASFFAFPIGIFFSLHEKEIRDFINRRFAVIIPAAIIMAAAIGLKFLGQSHSSQILMNFSDAVSSSLFVVIVYALLTKIKIGNSLLRFYGKISYEFYLLHGLSIFFSGYFLFPKYQLLFFISSIALTTVSAYLVNKITGRLTTPLLNKIKL